VLRINVIASHVANRMRDSASSALNFLIISKRRRDKKDLYLFNIINSPSVHVSAFKQRAYRCLFIAMKKPGYLEAAGTGDRDASSERDRPVKSGMVYSPYRYIVSYPLRVVVSFVPFVYLLFSLAVPSIDRLAIPNVADTRASERERERERKREKGLVRVESGSRAQGAVEKGAVGRKDRRRLSEIPAGRSLLSDKLLIPKS